VFHDFASQAEEKIFSLIAPNIIGLDEVKKAGLIQLFAKDKVHILLLGDPATGKTDILRSIADLAPISSYGLGSGASKAGLTVAVIGKDIAKGLLPMADNGIACIDELNLLKTADRAGLFNAMEKGFITYDKADSHLKIDARIKVFATANPEGERFVGRTIDVIKKQIPFDPALLSRFHLIFLIRNTEHNPGAKIQY
jgi:replicative DNA helicase Mcm